MPVYDKFGNLKVGNARSLEVITGWAHGATAASQAFFRRAGTDPLEGLTNWTIDVVYQNETDATAEQRLCGTSNNFLNMGACITAEGNTVRGHWFDNGGTLRTMSNVSSRHMSRLSFVTLTYSNGSVWLRINGAFYEFFAGGAGAYDSGSAAKPFSVGASADGLAAGASNLQIHGAALILGAGLTGTQHLQWWREIVATQAMTAGFASEAWAATTSNPTSTTWTPITGSVDLTRIGSASGLATAAEPYDWY